MTSVTYLEPPDPIICPACHGEGEGCPLCEDTGYVSASERREYIADARAERDG